MRSEAVPDTYRRAECPEERRYAGLDLLKLFFALCVAAIHTKALEGAPEPVYFWCTQVVFRMAVPFFFIASGFLLGKKLEDQAPEAVLRRYVKGLLPALLIVSIANSLPELLLQYLRYGTSFRKLISLFVRHFLFYPYGAMWFVQACVIGAGLLCPFLKRNKLRLALTVGFLLYGVALLCNNYYFVAQAVGLGRCADACVKFFFSARNGIFVGMFYLALGIATWRLHRRNFRPRTLLWVMVGSAALYLLEIYLLRDRAYLDDRGLYLSHIVLAPVLVLCIVRSRVPVSGSAAKRVRNASAWIYFSHRFIYVLGRIACYLIFKTDPVGIGAFAAVIALCLFSMAAGERVRRCSARWSPS